MEIPIPLWATWKALCVTTKNLNNQYAESASGYSIVGPDSNGINWLVEVPKKLADGSTNPDATDFEDTVKAACNFAIGQRPYAFATGDFQFIGDAAYDVCTAGQTKDIDYTFAQTLYVNGGNIILEGSVLGDWIEVNVIHPVYGAIASYVVRRYVPSAPVGEPSPLMDIKTPYAGKIPAGLKLRLTYHSIGGVDVKIALNLDLHKAI